MRSFRLKQAILTTLLTGVVLWGCVEYAATVIRHAGIKRADRELRALVEPQMRRVQPSQHWPVFDRTLRQMQSGTVSPAFLIRVDSANGKRGYASERWFPEWTRDRIAEALDGVSEQSPIHMPPKRHAQRAPRDEPPVPLAVRGPLVFDHHGDLYPWRIILMANPDLNLAVAMNMSDLDAEIDRFRARMLFALPVILVTLFAAGWLIALFALQPVREMEKTIKQITATRLDQRLSATRTDREFRQLINLINDMLERLQSGFQQARRFSADAAHELKTPLAILQGHVEQALPQAEVCPELQQSMADIQNEVQRLKMIIRNLLLLSQADAGELTLSREVVDVSELTRNAGEDANLLAPDRTITINAMPATVACDASMVRMVLDNLVTNAVKFGDPAGSITLSVQQLQSYVTVSVSNTGSTIPPSERDLIFKRFYRIDKARRRDAGGTGLGLSLSREIARAHGGDLFLEKSEANTTCFTLKLRSHDSLFSLA